eukprot:COSAG01_NODE_1423_length_10356_cov_30.529590_13_plen_163_part_00
MQEERRWVLLRCSGLIATLITVAGGNSVGQRADDHGQRAGEEGYAVSRAGQGRSTDHTRARSTDHTQKRPARPFFVAGAQGGEERRAEAQRLAAKTLAHMGTTAAIREKLMLVCPPAHSARDTYCRRLRWGHRAAAQLARWGRGLVSSTAGCASHAGGWKSE